MSVAIATLFELLVFAVCPILTYFRLTHYPSDFLAHESPDTVGDTFARRCTKLLSDEFGHQHPESVRILHECTLTVASLYRTIGHRPEVGWFAEVRADMVNTGILHRLQQNITVLPVRWIGDLR